MSERVDKQFLVTIGIERAQAQRQHKLRRLISNLDGPKIVEAQFRLLFQIHFGDEEMHLLFDVAAEHFRSAFRKPVTVFLEPCFQTFALFSGEDDDIVFAHRILSLNRDAEGFGATDGRLTRRHRGVAAHAAFHQREQARASVEIFDQPRRSVGIEMIDHFLIADVDLAALDQGRNGDYHSKLFRIAFKVVDHGDHGLVVLARQDDLRCFVKNLGVGFGDVKTAERLRGFDFNR